MTNKRYVSVHLKKTLATFNKTSKPCYRYQCYETISKQALFIWRICTQAEMFVLRYVNHLKTYGAPPFKPGPCLPGGFSRDLLREFCYNCFESRERRWAFRKSSRTSVALWMRSVSPLLSLALLSQR